MRPQTGQYISNELVFQDCIYFIIFLNLIEKVKFLALYKDVIFFSSTYFTFDSLEIFELKTFGSVWR